MRKEAPPFKIVGAWIKFIASEFWVTNVNQSHKS